MRNSTIATASFAILAAFCNAPAAAAAGAMDATNPAPTFGYIVEHAARIARIKVVSREPAYGDLLKMGPACGQILSATVVEAFKGGREPFKFFSATPSDFRGFGRDYMVVSFSQPDRVMSALEHIDDLLDPDTVYRMRCLFSQPYYVPTRYQTLWSFDPAAEKKFGGEWVLAADRKDGLFCGHQAEESVQKALKVRTVVEGGRNEHVVDWQMLRKLLVADIEKPQSPATCGIE